MELVQSGRLTIPLFHGTSTLHYESIRSNGLGARDIIEDMGIRRAAGLLFELSVPYADEDTWLDCRDACMRIAKDPATQDVSVARGIWSFRYGGTYVSASRETAARYAFLYGLRGGEALTHVHRLYEKLAGVDPKFCNRDELSFLREVSSSAGLALLVEAHSVEVASLRLEQGGGPEEGLKYLIGCEDPDDLELMAGQINFELTKPVAPDRLRFFTPYKETEFDGEGGSREVLRTAPYPPEAHSTSN